MKRLLVAALFAVGCGGSHSGNTPQPDAPCPDEDGDGVTTCAGDCDDMDPFTFPGSVEVCGDAKDNTCDGMADEGCGGIGTFVAGDPTRGNDANPGTQAQPVQTIAKGMANAQMLLASTGNAQSVFVAQGHYPENISMVEKISLRGGYDCGPATCTWARNPIAFDTAIDDQTYEGVLADNTITKATTFDGFRLRGKPNAVGGTPVGPAGSSCMSLVGGSPKITNNIFEPASITTAASGNNRSIGLRILSPTADASGALVDGNLFTGAQATDASFGIVFAAAVGSPSQAAVAVVSNNVINGGQSAQSRGITGFASGTGTVIKRNVITSGVGGQGDSWAIQMGGPVTIDANQINVNQANVGTCNGAQLCGGIDAGAATQTITNNVVYGMKAGRSAAVRLRDFEQALGSVTLNGNYLDGAGIGITTATTMSAALVLGVNGGVNVFVGKVRNNIMMGGINVARFGVFEEPNQQTTARTVHTEAFDHNDIFFLPARNGSGDVLYRFVPSGTPGTPALYTTVPQLEAAGAIGIKNNGVASGDLSADPMMDTMLHIAGTSPCVDTGTATEAPATDFEGTARPSGAGFEIGHDETP